MKTARRLRLLTAMASLVLTLPGMASADPSKNDGDRASASEAPVDAPAVRRFGVSVNPLRLAVRGVSLDAEWLAATHHAVVLSPSVTLGGADYRAESQTEPASAHDHEAHEPLLNLEGGYRFYSSSGLNGFFMGVFFVAAQAKAVYATGTESSWSGYAGLDIGGQHVFASGLTVGAGIGYQNVVLGDPTVGTDSYLHGGKIFPRGTPRLLLAVGYAF